MLKKYSFILLGLIIITAASFILISGTPGTDTDVKKARSFQFTYKLEVLEIPQDAEDVEIFMPIPVSNSYQAISDVKIVSPYDYDILEKPQYNCRILHMNVDDKISDSLQITLQFNVNRKAILDPQQYNFTEVRKADLLPDELIPITGKIKREAMKALKKSEKEENTAHIFYNYLINTMEYDKSGTGWGEGDAIYACTVRKGNCTDFHSLFIGMCRAVNIPARFYIGFPIPDKANNGEVGGYHCWAKFYSPDLGWVPVDISEASKHPQKRDFYYGSLDANRVLFTSGRDIPVTTSTGKEITLNYFVYPEVLVNGTPYHNAVTSFYYNNNSK